MRKYELYDYQKKACQQIYSDMLAEQHVLLSAIMGAGKTAMAACLAEAVMTKQPGINILILAHKEKLLTQFHAAFGKFTDVSSHKIGLSCAGLRQKVISSQITIASAQTFVSQKENYELGAGFLIIDEAHRISIGNDSQYDQIIHYLKLQRPNMRILGLTATPFRLGFGYIYGADHMPNSDVLFPRCNHKIGYKELLDAGHSVPLRGKVAVTGSYKTDIKSIKINGDYVIEQIGEMMSRPVYITDAVDAIAEECVNYKCLCVLCCTIDHAEILCDAIGDEATIVHSKLTKIEKFKNMYDWESGKKRIIVSVNMLTEGVDFPKLDCLVMNRPTESAGLFLQSVGRLLRLYEGKAHGFLLDLTENTSKFGTDLDNIKIKIPRSALNKKKEEFEKICPNCDAIVHKTLHECDVCKYEWPITVLQDIGSAPDMIEVDFEPEHPVWYEASDISFIVHTSRKNQKQLIKCIIEYKTHDSSIPFFANIWFCLSDFYSGYAVKKSSEKWKMLSDGEMGMLPNDCDEFIETSSFMTVPNEILIQPGKFPEILDVVFRGDPVVPF